MYEIFSLYPIKGRKVINYRTTMQTKKSKSSGQRIIPETGKPHFGIIRLASGWQFSVYIGDRWQILSIRQFFYEPIMSYYTRKAHIYKHSNVKIRGAWYK